MEGIDLFVKILVFVKILSRVNKEGRVREASSSHLINMKLVTFVIGIVGGTG